MKKYLAITLAVVLAVSMLAGCGKSKKSKSQFDSQLKDYTALMNGDVSELEAMAPDAFWDWLEDQYGERDEEFDFEDYQDDVLDGYDDMIDEKEDEVGKNVEFSMEIQKEEEMDEDYVESLGEFLEEKYDIDEKDVTQAYELKLKLTAEGDDGDDSNKEYITMVEIDGQWYAMRVDDNKGEVESASFVIEFH